MVNLEFFEKEHKCTYKDECYSVRDNGSILRHPKNNERVRPLDNRWTFGKLNTQNGYLHFSNERIHRVVAKAFLDEPPTADHIIVDHINTNKHDNRPENLRWVTRLENTLFNPITVKRLEYICGCSVEEFLENPHEHQHKFTNPNFAWMRRVTKEESRNCRDNLMAWAKSDKYPKGGALGEWIYSRNLKAQAFDQRATFSKSLTPNALQKNWQTQTLFPACPVKITSSWLKTYKSNLKKHEVFSQNQYGKSFVENVDINETTSELVVLTKNDNIKPFALAKIYVLGEQFIHESAGSFFTENGGLKRFNLALGLEWHGEDSIDDYA